MAAAKSARGLTIKQEKFAQAFVELGCASKAYRRAYSCERMKPHTIHDNAHNLLHNAVVAPRIEQLQAENAAKFNVTIEGLTEKLESARKLAEKEGQASAAVAAIMGIAKLHGFLVDKVESKIANFVVEAPAQCESTEQWLEQCAIPQLAQNSSRDAGELLEFVQKPRK